MSNYSISPRSTAYSLPAHEHVQQRPSSTSRSLFARAGELSLRDERADFSPRPARKFTPHPPTTRPSSEQLQFNRNRHAHSIRAAAIAASARTSIVWMQQDRPPTRRHTMPEGITGNKHYMPWAMKAYQPQQTPDEGKQRQSAAGHTLSEFDLLDNLSFSTVQDEAEAVIDNAHPLSETPLTSTGSNSPLPPLPVYPSRGCAESDISITPKEVNKESDAAYFERLALSIQQLPELL